MKLRLRDDERLGVWELKSLHFTFLFVLVPNINGLLNKAYVVESAKLDLVFKILSRYIILHVEMQHVGY